MQSICLQLPSISHSVHRLCTFHSASFFAHALTATVIAALADHITHQPQKREGRDTPAGVKHCMQPLHSLSCMQSTVPAQTCLHSPLQKANHTDLQDAVGAPPSKQILYPKQHYVAGKRFLVRVLGQPMLGQTADDSRDGLAGSRQVPELEAQAPLACHTVGHCCTRGYRPAGCGAAWCHAVGAPPSKQILYPKQHYVAGKRFAGKAEQPLPTVLADTHRPHQHFRSKK
jgi:hypothetical protein